MMTMRERVEAFKHAYAKWPASWPHISQEQGRDVLYAHWLIGNDYRNKTTYHGAYPRGYVERVRALFPDIPDSEMLHAFSGSLPAGDYLRCDMVQPAEFHCAIYDLPALVGYPAFSLVMADPPYTDLDAEKYKTPPVNRGRATRALAEVVKPGGYLVWLDICWPMHRKDQWVTVGRIAVTRSTNHCFRGATIFERVA